MTRTHTLIATTLTALALLGSGPGLDQQASAGTLGARPLVEADLPERELPTPGAVPEHVSEPHAVAKYLERWSPRPLPEKRTPRERRPETCPAPKRLADSATGGGSQSAPLAEPPTWVQATRDGAADPLGLLVRLVSP